ncbi:Lipin/Ned1/Smp2-domain-containing protein [Entophlyctis helioformis]|nr:Lipin/Ned1/Smp2-domain-containing protein [Entophlyctis helioformis]
MTSIVTDLAGRVVSTISAVGSFYNDINPSTLSGAIDVVVVEHETGELHCSPFHVRFGKLQLLRPSEKVVEVSVNGKPTDLEMKVGDAGEAFFVVEAENPVPSEYATSPIQLALSPQEEPIEQFSLNDARSARSSSPEPPVLMASEMGTGATTQGSSHRHVRASSDMTALTMSNAHGIAVHQGHDGANSTSVAISMQSTRGPPIEYPTSDSGIDDPTALGHGRGPLSDGVPDFDSSKVMGTSPSNGWSWSWGGLPEKRTDQKGWDKDDASDVLPGLDERGMTHKTRDQVVAQDHLRVRASSPALRSTYQSGSASKPPMSTMPPGVATTVTANASMPMAIPGSRMPSQPTPSAMSPSSPDDGLSMSVSEKIDSYLAGLPQSPPTRPLSPDPMSILQKTADDSLVDALAIQTGVVIAQTPAASATTPAAPDGAALGSSTTPSAQSAVAATPAEAGPMKLELSLCGQIKELRTATPQAADIIFKKQLVSFEAFCDNPAIVSDPNLVVRVVGHYASWSSIAPVLLAQTAFGKPLTEEGIRKAVLGMRTLNNQASSSSLASSAAAAGGTDARRYSFGQGLRSWWGRSGSTVAQPDAGKRVGDAAGMDKDARRSVNNLAGPEAAGAPSLSPTTQPMRVSSIKHRYAKSLRLTSDQLKSLNLHHGNNTISFTVTTKLQGKATCTANIFYWMQDDKVVISDIDGTITKSDVLGHMFTMVGRDWTHAGVANLYTNINKNGYKFLYLTSRAIGQAGYTRDYLKKVEQDRYQLPEGPVIMSPDRLLRAFTREVILRKPEEFKIACLRDIKRLFGDRTPFYGGFGNRITDALSYRSVEVPSSRIFTIDPTGEVKLELMSNFKSSYIKLNDVVDQMFPPLSRSLEGEFTDWSYWRSELPEIKIDVGGSKTHHVPPPPDENVEDSDDDEEDDFDDEDGDSDEEDFDEHAPDAKGANAASGAKTVHKMPSAGAGAGAAPAAAKVHAAKPDAVDADDDDEQLLEQQEAERLAAMKNTPF